MLYRQTITYKTQYGTASVSSEGTHSLEKAIRLAVDMALDDGWRPREHWWQVWLPKAPSAAVLAEYQRRKTQPLNLETV